MNEPRLENVVETFIPITVRGDATQIEVWQDYIDLLRLHVAPVIQDLCSAGLVGWYSFLVHNRQSGVPTDESDEGVYVHLRLEMSGDVKESDLVARLPQICKMTRRMPTPERNRLDNNDLLAFRGQRVECGWRVLGECSAWVLAMLDSHDPSVRVPPQNVAQLLHYLGNSLFVRCVGIPMP